MSSPADERSLFGRPGWIAAAALLAVALITLVACGSSDGTPQAGPSSASAAASTPAASSPDCGVSDTSQAVPASAPNGVTWTVWNGEALPSSATDGPGKVTGAVPTCYSHTPVGALIALAQFDLRTEVAHDPDLAVITAGDCLPNAGEKVAEKVYLSGADVSDYTADYQVAGFEFVSYTTNSAVIQLAMLQTNGGYESSTYSMQWNNGDWPAVLNADGSFGTAFSGISDLAGYVPWAGAS